MTNTTTAARITPCFETFASVIRFAREDAERSDDQATEVAAYSLLWFCGTGRAFTGAQRAFGHMTRGTAKAFLARLTKAMRANAKARGSIAVVTADLDNATLARCFGFSSVEDALQATCDHPFGVAYRIAA